MPQTGDVEVESEVEDIKPDIATPYTCKDCDAKFTDQSDFLQHRCSEPKKKNHEQGRFKCEKCGKFFRQKRILVQHYLLHRETFDFACPFCEKKFKTKPRLKCHIQTHTARYTCPVCGKGFGENGNLKKHLRIHSGERPFVCGTCNKSFTQKSHLQDHELTHKNQLNYHCECGKSFISKQALKVHRLIHTKELPFKCNKCNASFARQSGLKLHSFTHTSDRPFHCEFCGAGFKRQRDLKSHDLKYHIQKSHDLHSRELLYACEICQKPFHTPALLKSHMVTHSDERPFKCSLCDKGFKCMSTLKKHCILHTGERSKVCELCGKTFKGSNTLRTHYLTHTEDRPYQCDVCGRRFKRITPFQNHLKVHTGELAYSCEKCGKRFARKGTLENHFILHTGEKPYKCPVCDRGFTRKSSLKIHQAAVHCKNPDPKKLDNRAQHLVAGDIARYAILAAHNCISEEDEVNRKRIAFNEVKVPVPIVKSGHNVDNESAENGQSALNESSIADDIEGEKNQSKVAIYNELEVEDSNTDEELNSDKRTDVENELESYAMNYAILKNNKF